MRRVYVLGAGASREETKDHHMPLPLVNEFFMPSYLSEFPPSIFDVKKNSYSLRKGNYFLRSPLSLFLEAFYGEKARFSEKICSHGFRLNIEEVASFLTSILQGQPEMRNEIDFTRSYDDLLDYIYSLIHGICWEYTKQVDPTHSLYSLIAKSVSRNDTIITFNWDYLMDSALAKFAEEYLKESWELVQPSGNEYNPNVYAESESRFNNSVFKSRISGFYLKMHGSINWAACPDKNCYRSLHPIIASMYDSESIPWERCDRCGRMMKWYIMEPTSFKSYSENRLFRLQYNLAYDALFYANQVIIYGFSMSETDIRAKHLFRSSNNGLDAKEYIVVDPMSGDSIFQNRFKDLLLGGGNSIKFLSCRSDLELML